MREGRAGVPVARRVWVRAVAWAAVAAVSAAASAQTAPPGSAERLAQVAEAHAAQQGFSGAVLVARGDAVLLSRGFGLASHEWGVANAPDVKYLLASVSKQFTAAAVLRLVDQGRLRLDDPVHRHLPDTPAAWHAVTVRQLLAHTAGIPSHTEGEAFERQKRQAHTPRELWESFRQRPLDFRPGSAFRYSNSGYVMLGLLVEQLSGLSWADFVERELLAPLGLRDTGVASGARITPRLATGYVRARRSGPPALLPAGFLHLSVPYAAGAMYGSTGDLLAWQRALYSGRVLSDAALREMTTPLREDYALGLNVSRRAGRLQYGHSGGIDGFSTFLLYEPQAQLSVVVLSNVQGAPAEAFARKLAAVAQGQALRLAHELRPVALSEAALAAVQGAYRVGELGTLWLQPSGGQLWARLNQSPWTRLLAESPTEFVAIDEDAELRVALGGDAGDQARDQAREQTHEQARAVSVTLRDATGTHSGPRLALPPPNLTAQPLYLRGGMNAWSLRDRLQRADDGLHRIALDLPAGEHPLKVATEDWRSVDLGDGLPDETALTGAPSEPPRALVVAGANLVLRLAQPSRCRFAFDGRDPVQPQLGVACQPLGLNAPRNPPA